MTLHIAVACGSFVLTAGDRLLSAGRPGSYSDWDACSNKTIIVYAQNGLVSVAYSGLAFVGGRPTDECLVEAISGRNRRVFGAGDGSAISIGPPTKLTTGGVCSAVTAWLQELPGSQRDSIGVSVLVSGWTWKRRSDRDLRICRTFVRGMSHSGVSGDAVVSWSANPIWLRPGSMLGIHTAIGNSQPGGVEWLNDVLSDPMVTMDVIESAVVDEIRRQSRIPNSGIGSNVMTVVMPMDPYLMKKDGGILEVRYHRDLSFGEDLMSYSPAVITRGGVVSWPLQITGPSVPLSINGFSLDPRLDLDLEFEVIPPIQHNGVQGFESQRRKQNK